MSHGAPSNNRHHHPTRSVSTNAPLNRSYRNSDNTVSFEDQVCSKTFEFRPTTLTGLADMAYSGDISGLCPGGVSFYTFTIGALDEDSETPLEVLLIDNVELDTVSCI